MIKSWGLKRMYKLSSSQAELVSNVESYVNGLLIANNVKTTNTAIIQAPTGAGKTVLIAHVANFIAKNDPDAIILIVTIPKNTLYIAASESIKDSIVNFGLSKLAEPISVDKDTELNKVLGQVVRQRNNKHTVITMAENYFNKTTKCGVNYNTMSDFIQKVRNNGKHIYCFIDEAHYTFENANTLLSSNSNFVFYVTATPDANVNVYKTKMNFFRISEQDALEDDLLVDSCYNQDFDDILIGANDLIEIKECANNMIQVDELKQGETLCYKVIRPRFVSCLNVFIKTLQQVNLNYSKVIKTFKDAGIKSIPDKMNICGMIQISNSGKGKNEYEVITSYLNTQYPDLKYVFVSSSEVTYSDNFIEAHKELKTLTEKEKKDSFMKYVKEADSDIDIIIFKQRLVEGTNIPRCHVLMQIRDTVSPTLTKQFQGRGLRNPFFVALQELESSSLEDSKKKDLLQLFKKNCNTVYFGFPECAPDSHTLHVSVAKGVVLPMYNFSIKPHMTISDEETLVQKFEEMMELYDGSKNDAVYKRSLEFLTSKEPLASDIEQFRQLLKDAIVTGKLKLSDACNVLTDVLNNVENMELNVNSVTKNREDDFVSKIAVAEHGYFAELSGTSLQMNVDEVKSLKKSAVYYDEKNKSHKFTENTIILDSKAEMDFVKILNKVIETGKVSKQGKNNIIFKNPVYAHKYAISFHLDYREVKKYPDFVFMDKNDKIHIIEVKSYNTSNTQQLNVDEYTKKTEKLKEVFKSLCQVEGIKNKFYFDVAIQTGKKWEIQQSYNGETTTFYSSKDWVNWIAENA